MQAHEAISPILPSDEECPFDIDLIQDAINHLPAKKTSRVDHLRIEMIKPMQNTKYDLLIQRNSLLGSIACHIIFRIKELAVIFVNSIVNINQRVGKI